VFRIRPLFHACFLVLEIPLLLTTAHSTSGNLIYAFTAYGTDYKLDEVDSRALSWQDELVFTSPH
jgi:hypothetical protein